MASGTSPTSCTYQVGLYHQRLPVGTYNVVFYFYVGTIKQAQLAAIQHNREVIARYRALAKTPGALRCLMYFDQLSLIPPLQWAIKTPSRSSCKPASKRSRLSKTEDRLQPTCPRSRLTQAIHILFPLQLRHSLFFLPRLRVLPLPRLRPLDHPPHQRLHLFPRVAACKHTRTRSRPFGTVGHVIGRAFKPRARRWAESGRGYGVRMGMIGVGSVRCTGAARPGGCARCGGSARRDKGMRRRCGRRRARKCALLLASWLASCAAVPSSRRSKEQSTETMFAWLREVV